VWTANIYRLLVEIHIEVTVSVTSDGAWWSQIATHHVTRHKTPIHNILSTVPQFSIPEKALGTLPENGKVVPKHVGATIHN
jgi:hypothetical protein